MPTSFPTFVDTPEGEEPEPGTPLVAADYLNSVGVAINTVENSLPGFVEASELATVATTGAYTDLIGAPFIPTAASDIGAQPAGSYQASDADLTSIAAMTPTDNDILQRKSGAWTNRTPAQVKTDLALAKGDVGLGNVDNTSDADKPISTATQVGFDSINAGGDTITANLAALETRVDALDGVTDLGALTATVTLTPGGAAGLAQLMTLTQDCTVTLEPGTADGRIKALELVITQGGAGSWLITWNATVRWRGGPAPELSTAVGTVDRIMVTSYDNGVTWYGDVIGQGYV